MHKNKFALALVGLWLGLWTLNLHAADTRIVGTVTITNVANITGTNSESITVNSSTRTFTNAVASAATQIYHTNGMAITPTVSYLLAHLGSYPFSGVSMSSTSPSNVIFYGALNGSLTIALTNSNWGSVSYVTNTFTSATVVRVPVEVESATTRTNVPSLLWQALQDYSLYRLFSSLTLSNATAAGTLAVSGGLGAHGTAKTNSYTITTNDLYVGADTRNNTNLILTLPSASAASNLLFVIKDEGGAGATNTLKIYPASGDRLDSLLTNLTISNNFGGAILRSRGSTNWNILATGGGVTGGIATSGGSVEWTNTVFVAKNGNDTTGARGDASKPFLTLLKAKTNAIAGDTIFVLPGTYNEKNLLKHQVNWHFFNGAKVNYTGGADGSIFDDSSNGADTNITSVITGEGVFENHGSAEYYVVDLEHADSDLRIQGRSMTSDDYVVVQCCDTNTLTLSGFEITGTARNPVFVNGANCTTILERCRLEMQDTDNNGAALYFFSANTNSTLRDSVLIGNASAGSPVAIKGGVAGTEVRVHGGLTKNLDDSANVTLVQGENRFFAGDTPYNNVVYHPTNAAPLNIDATDFALDTNYTNGNQRAYVSACLTLTATNSADAVVSLYLDQDASGGFEQTGITAQLGGGSPTNYWTTNIVQIGAWIQPGGVFAFTNLSVAPATAAVNAGGSQWVKQ